MALRKKQTKKDSAVAAAEVAPAAAAAAAEVAAAAEDDASSSTSSSEAEAEDAGDSDSDSDSDERMDGDANSSDDDEDDGGSDDDDDGNDDDDDDDDDGEESDDEDDMEEDDDEDDAVLAGGDGTVRDNDNGGSGGGGEHCTFDLSNLLAFNTHQINAAELYQKSKMPDKDGWYRAEPTIPPSPTTMPGAVSEALLLSKAAEGATQLLRELWKLPNERTDVGTLARLPRGSDETKLPRSLVSFAGSVGRSVGRSVGQSVGFAFVAALLPLVRSFECLLGVARGFIVRPNYRVPFVRKYHLTRPPKNTRTRKQTAAAPSQAEIQVGRVRAQARDRAAREALAQGVRRVDGGVEASHRVVVQQGQRRTGIVADHRGQEE